MANDANGIDRPSDAFVTVTKREIYDAVMRLDTAVREQSLRINELLGDDGPIRDLKRRTRALELKVWGLLSGMLPVIGLLVMNFLEGSNA